MTTKITINDAKEKQPTAPGTVLSAKRKSTFTPARFSVGKLRKHPGIQKDRNPVVFQ